MKFSESVTLVNNNRKLFIRKLQSAHTKDHMIKNNKLGDFNPIFMISHKLKINLLLLLFEKFHKIGQKKNLSDFFL